MVPHPARFPPVGARRPVLWPESRSAGRETRILEAMSMTRLLRCGMLVSLVVLAFVGEAFADDPPSRVARLSYADGSVSFRPGNLDDWAPASRNRPLTTGDRLWTDKRSRS